MEIAPLTFDVTNTASCQTFVAMYISVMQVVHAQLLNVDLRQVYTQKNNAGLRVLLRQITIFITEFLKAHRELLENGAGNPSIANTSQQGLLAGLSLLIRLSQCQEGLGDQLVIFDICLDFWSAFLEALYKSERGAGVLLVSANGGESERLTFYSPVLNQLRLVMIQSMARPEEVLVVQNDDGTVDHQRLRNHDAVTLYINMREILIWLTNLNQDVTTDVMFKQLSDIVRGPHWNPHQLNRTCWAIGSISRALTVAQEKKFVVNVIKVLLNLVDAMTKKEQKAIIAANIMYVVGQYPRFLKLHWKFLETVAYKLFEFMAEKFQGVRDMSVNTFLKIAIKCRKKFVVSQGGEPPFINTILNMLPTLINELEKQQMYIFYEAVGHIVAVEPDANNKQRLLAKVMAVPNEFWTKVCAELQTNVDTLYQSQTLDLIELILKTNTVVCSTLQTGGFITQLTKIYIHMLQIYQLLSTAITSKIRAVQAQGHVVDALVFKSDAQLRQFQTVKMETLRLVSTFVDTNSSKFNPNKFNDAQTIVQNFLPKLVEPVLEDYKVRGGPIAERALIDWLANRTSPSPCVSPPAPLQNNCDQARDAEVLQLFASFITSFSDYMTPHIPLVFKSTFSVTLSTFQRRWLRLARSVFTPMESSPVLTLRFLCPLSQT